MNKKAFTLIELLVVVLIIGILAAIALPQYNKAVMKSRLAEVKIMAKKYAEGKSLCYLENGGDEDACSVTELGYFPNFEPPTELMYDDDCSGGGVCFETQNWTYVSDDGFAFFAFPKNQNSDFYLQEYDGNGGLVCWEDESLCKGLGFTNCNGYYCYEP